MPPDFAPSKDEAASAMLAALKAAQGIAVHAIHTPPINDPRWAQIADAIAAAEAAGIRAKQGGLTES